MSGSNIIQLNGKEHPLKQALSVADLLESIGWGGRAVVVELNEEPVFPREYGKTMVEPGARVEIVALAAGG